ncbi:hypothetical protein QQ045_008051 [Rhodiola kirilowii]
MQREGGERASESRVPFGGLGNLMSSLFGGFRDPFDDPFFTRPFGSVFGSNMVETSDQSDDASPAAKGVVIKELNSDGEEEENEENMKQEHSPAEKESSEVIRRNDHEKKDDAKPQVKSQSFSYRKVTYGGVDGAYRTSTVSRRTGSDGVVLEESKAADKITGQAEHRISRGIQHKGHSVTRMLKPDGKVETVQTLHNLNEDELAGFEESSWKGNIAGKHSGGQWKDRAERHHFPGAGSGRWDSSLVNWNEKMNPVVAASRTDDRARTSSSSEVRAKKIG